MITNSLRWRIQAWHALILTLVIAGFGLTAHRFAVASRLKAIDDELLSHLAQLGIAFPPSARDPAVPERRPPQRASIPAQIEATGTYYAVWSADGSLQAGSGSFPRHIERPPKGETSELALTRTIGEERIAWRETGFGRCLLVGRSIAAARSEWRRLAWLFTAIGIGVLGLGLLGGWWAASLSIRPIAAIRATAEKIARGDLSQRVPTVDTDDELARLAVVLNTTFARLDEAFARQSRFTADAAHELRTPVATILTHTQNGLAANDLDPGSREAFAACERSARRMRRLIDALLDLARFDAGEEPLRIEPCDLAGIAGEGIAALGKTSATKVVPDLAAAPCTGDEVRLGQVVTNLLANALEHAASRVEVTTRREGGEAVLMIRDDGPGIAAEHLPRLFDRFYRADSARSGGAVHAGLGLAIVHAIVDAHGGTIAVTSTQDEGATFMVRLPDKR